MIYVALPLSKIETGRPIPVNVWDPKGNLLMRKGQSILSDRHREFLAAHQAGVSEADFKAWTRSYERLVYSMHRDGASVEQIAATCMPAEILGVDYATGHDVIGGWLDLHELLRALLSQGPAARNPLDRIAAIQARATSLALADADACLFTLFQALPDRLIDYCAKHALLSALVCELTGQKLQVPERLRAVLFRAALLMNIAMAREQDELARQTDEPSAGQKRQILEHPASGVEILRGYGLVDADLQDIVRWHHAPVDPAGLPRNLECRQILCTADKFIAKIAARATRAGLSPLSAAKFALADQTDNAARIGSAMSTALGFYPPGTYLTLANGETAVAVRRGAGANTPLVVSVVGQDGLALAQYVGRDTRDPRYAARTPVNAERLKIRLHADKIERAVGKVQPGA